MNTHVQSDPSLGAEHPGSRAPRTWKAILAYDGTDFHGWQIQPGRATVQGELQAALGRVTGESPLPQGSGRTDAGVHALGQVASFALQAAIPADNLKRALNRTLPEAIRVVETRPVANDFHARHSTLAKTYEYRVLLERTGLERAGLERTGRPGETRRDCPPFLARYVLPYPWPLELGRMEQAAAAFVGTHDFTSFAATDAEVSLQAGFVAADMSDEDGPVIVNPVRTIFGSRWLRRTAEDGELWIYQVRGSGFLHHMVRNLVGTMLDIGRGYREPGEVAAMLAARARAAAGPTAPARGLYLHSVEYEPGHEG